jgi:predicted ferric reductase
MATLALATPVARARRVPSWWRDAIGIAVWVTGLVVVGLWLHGGGAQDLSGGRSEMLTSLGRLSGLVAADLLLIQVFLMARVPAVERTYGQDELVRKHRVVGTWSFVLMLAHVVLITLGYAAASSSGFAHELWTVVTTYPGMLMATVATLALVMVAVSSARVARRRLRYETWHLVHLYAYVGVGFSIPHEIWTGGDLTSSPVASAYWVGTYLVAAGAVLVHRVGRPLWYSLRHDVRVVSVERESHDVVTVHMTGRHLHRLPARAGQFFVWRFLDGRGWSRGNPYSLSAPPRPDHLQISVKEQGDGSRRLAGLRPGTRVLLEGPFGRLTEERREHRRVAFLACGIGITPLKALLESMPYDHGDATLVHRVRAPEDAAFHADLEQLARDRGVVVHHLVGPRITNRTSWLPAHAVQWDDAQALLALVPDLLSSDVYVCGPQPWTDAVTEAARRAGLRADRLHTERFAW